MPYFLFGARIDYLINKEPGIYNENPDDWPYSSNKSIWLAELSDFSYGPTFGVGLQIGSIFPVPIIIESCYNIDVTDNNPEKLESKNTSIDIWFGVVF